MRTGTNKKCFTKFKATFWHVSDFKLSFVYLNRNEQPIERNICGRGGWIAFDLGVQKDVGFQFGSLKEEC